MTLVPTTLVGVQAETGSDVFVCSSSSGTGLCIPLDDGIAAEALPSPLTNGAGSGAGGTATSLQSRANAEGEKVLTAPL